MRGGGGVFALVALASIVCATRGAAQAAPGAALASERLVLANGLEVILEPDPSSARVAVVVAYGAGSSSDPPGLAGLAHMAEHMAFRRSLHVGEQQFFDLPHHWGAAEQTAFTAQDATVYQMLVPPEQLARALWLESERMAFVLPALRADQLALERRIIAGEYALRDLPVPGLLRELSYPEGHPQRAFNRAAATSALPELDLGAVQWFFQRVYRPDNACLVLVGDFDPSEAKQLIERYFAGIGNPRVPRLTTREQPVQFSGSARARIRANDSREVLYEIWTLPAGAYDEQRAALTGIATLLNKHVHDELAHVAGIASTGGVRWDRSAGGDRFMVQIITSERGKLPELERALDAELERLRSTPLSKVELDALRRRLSWRLLHQRETALSRALLHATDRPLGSAAPFDYDTLAAALRGLSAEQLMAAARALLPAERRLIVLQEAAPNVKGAALITVEGELFTPTRELP